MVQLYNGFDLSTWDSRSFDLAVKYRLEKWRLERTLRMCDGDYSRSELEYLRHLGQEIFMDSNQEREGMKNKNGTIYPIVLNLKREARRIFELYEELVEKHPTMKNYSLRAQMGMWREYLTLYIDTMESD